MKKHLLFIMLALGGMCSPYSHAQDSPPLIQPSQNGGATKAYSTGLRNEVPSRVKYQSVRMIRDLPSHFDWRENMGGALQPVRDQGSCGSCWSFAIIAQLESNYTIDGQGFNPNTPNHKLDLAEQTMVSSCCRSCGSCSGGYFTALDYVKSNGIPWESSDKYQGRNSSCKNAPASYHPKIHDWFYVGQSGRAPTTEEVKSALLAYGVLSVGVNGNFGNYRSGVYSSCGSTGINHMVTIVGWDDEKQAWIMQNSWGPNWGMDGFMYIKYKDSRGRPCNGIAAVAAAVMLYPWSGEEILANRSGKYNFTFEGS